MCLSAAWGGGVKGYLVTYLGSHCQLNSSATYSSPRLWAVVMRQNVTRTLRVTGGSGTSEPGSGGTEPCGRGQPFWLHTVSPSKQLPLFLVCLLTFSWDSAADNGMCPTTILDYSGFCLTLHSLDIPAVCRRHQSGAGSEFLSMLLRARW